MINLNVTLAGGVVMLLHIFIIILQCAAVAAFLIVWYFWVKRKFLVHYVVQDEEQVLFPFRHFSWIVLGLLIITSVTQIHFVRQSALMHERFLTMTGYYQKHEFSTNAVEELKNSVEKLRKEMFANFGQLRAQQLASKTPGSTSWNPGDSSQAALSDGGSDTGTASRGSRSREDEGFGAEAKASSATAGPVKKSPKEAMVQREPNGDSPAYSMKLSCLAKVTVPKLRVRKTPDLEAPIIDSLSEGQEVKVTEKRLSKDTMWFRVITPSGLAGWVNYRFLKIEGQV